MLAFVRRNAVKEFMFKIIETNEMFLGEHKVIGPKQQFLGIMLCSLMYLKWPWLLRFFGKMLKKQFKFLLFLSIFHCATSSGTTIMLIATSFGSCIFVAYINHSLYHSQKPRKSSKCACTYNTRARLICTLRIDLMGTL